MQELDPFLPHLAEADFYGGEPFLIESYLKIWERMIEVNPTVQVYVQTNGTILNNRVRNIVERIPMNIGISLDSVVPETYEAIRLNARFDRVLEHVEYFRTTLQAKKQHVFLSMCLLRQNAHELPHYMQFANARELEVYVHHVHWPPEHSLQPLPSDALYKLLARLQMGQLELLKDQNSKVYAHNLAAYRQVLETLAQWAGQNRKAEIREQAMRRELGQLRYQTRLLISRAKATDELLARQETERIEQCIFNWANQRDSIAEVLDRYQSTWNNLQLAEAFQPIALTVFLFLSIEELNHLFENNNAEAMISAYQVSLARAAETSQA
jgi:MoaA/NifB/PqqE/SkfB family radical SAM enzyme